jgi:hypothetical protein
MRPSPGVLPAPVEALLDAVLVGELTVVRADGVPVTYPLIPPLRRPAPVGVPARPFPRATILGDAAVPDEDLHSGWERLLPLWRAKEPVIDSFVKKRFGIPVFFERSIIEITPRRALWWEDGRTDIEPAVFELAGVG